MKRSLGKPFIAVQSAEYARRKKETGSVKDLEKSDRPRIYDEREERLIVKEALKQNKESITSLTQNQFINPKEVCKSTVNGILLSLNVHSLVRSLRLADLSKDNVKDRKKFAKTYSLDTIGLEIGNLF